MHTWRRNSSPVPSPKRKWSSKRVFLIELILAMYLLRKWYLDLLTPGGDYLFLYFAFVRLAGVTFRSLVLHVAPAGAADPITIPLHAQSHEDRAGEDRHLQVRLDSGAIRIGPEGCQVLVANEEVTLDLAFATTTHSGRERVRIDGPRGSHILWEPVGLRYSVEGRVLVRGVRFSVRGGAGYADFLESTVLPPEVPVRRLHWGRVHGPASDLVFMHASGLAGTPSSSRLILRGETIQESDRVLISGLPGRSAGASTADGYLLTAPLPGGEFRMTVRHQKTVQKAAFIDQQKFGPLLAALVRKVTRNPRGTKYLSRAEIPAWGRGGYSMIDEEAYL
jgi:hypothetical protein